MRARPGAEIQPTHDGESRTSGGGGLARLLHPSMLQLYLTLPDFLPPVPLLSLLPFPPAHDQILPSPIPPPKPVTTRRPLSSPLRSFSQLFAMASIVCSSLRAAARPAMRLAAPRAAAAAPSFRRFTTSRMSTFCPRRPLARAALLRSSSPCPCLPPGSASFLAIRRTFESLTEL